MSASIATTILACSLGAMLVAATPISHVEYASSRFLGAFGVLAAILAPLLTEPGK